MNHNLIILAAGASSRMKNSVDEKLDVQTVSQANQRTKGLISIDDSGRPLLDFLLCNAKKAGYTNIYLVVSTDHKLIKQHYGKQVKDNHYNGLRISYAIQHIPKNRIKPWGTADAVAQALQQYPKLQSEYFTVCNSDNLYSKKAFSRLLEIQDQSAFIAYDRDALQFETSRINQFALTSLDRENYLKDIIEKPNEDDLKKYQDSEGVFRVSMNIFRFYGPLFSRYVLNCPVSSKRNEKELPTALLNMVKAHPKSVLGVPLSEHVPDMTSKADIGIMKTYIKANYPDFEWK